MFFNYLEKMDNYYFLNSSNKKCCLVEKKYDETGFYYHYTKTNCSNLDNVKEFTSQINSSRLLTNTQFPYNLCNYYDVKKKEKDKTFSKRLGSCRRIDRECFDFTTKKTCDKYNMRWASVPCNTPIKYSNKIIK
tara:strand:- start:317 stop:718 length:402 start_codon:yes stop_codon:yes gene_type:complete